MRSTVLEIIAYVVLGGIMGFFFAVSQISIKIDSDRALLKIKDQRIEILKNTVDTQTQIINALRGRFESKQEEDQDGKKE